MDRRTSRLERIADALAFAVERFLAIALIVGIALNFFNVVGRYATGYTLTGVDEIEIYILIWIAFLGAAAITWRGQHLRMDVLLNSCPPVLRKAVTVAEMCVMLAVASFVAYHSFRYVERIYALGAISDIARVPTWFPHSAVFVSFAAIALVVLIRMGRALFRRGGSSAAPAESESHQ